MIRDYDMVEANQAKLSVPTRMTLRERLEDRKKDAEEALADIMQALEFLDKNPSFEAFHNLIGKAIF